MSYLQLIGMRKVKSGEHQSNKKGIPPSPDRKAKRQTASGDRKNPDNGLYLQLGNVKFHLRIVQLAVGTLAIASSVAIGKLFIHAPSVNTQTVLAADSRLTSELTTEASHIYAVSPNVLAIEIAAPTVTLGKQQPYVAQPTDVASAQGDRTLLTRSGQIVGELVGPDRQLFYPYDQVAPQSLNIAAADSPSSYLISSDQDIQYSAPTAPLSVFRKTKPTAFASDGPNESRTWPAGHTLYLTLPAPIAPGQTYNLSFPGLGLAAASFSYEPTTSRSEAVQVSQLGFRPDDPLKVGYLSTWMGNGGGLDYADGLAFQLIKKQTNAPVYQGRSRLIRPQRQAEDPRGNDYTLTEVHQLNFSDFSEPGEYRLCVDGVGCSFSFEISTDVWDQAFFTSARGFYHQRSGIKIGAPFTRFTRPRAFHPDDGVTIYQSNVSLLEVDMGLGTRSTFESLVNTKTNQTVPDAWGGYFDAGDWDRRIQHLTVPRSLLELNNLFPQHFQSLSLNIPESANALPDILDEALWSLDFFRRLQTEEGGIRGGIESAEHPNYGEASWQESLPVMAYAPDVWSSYLYAGVAARAAYTLRNYDPQLAVTYQTSALRAMAYGEAHYVEYKAAHHAGELQHHVTDQRNLAALELYRLTRDAQWHDVFLATTVFKDAQAEASVYASHEQRDAAFLYARLNESFADKADASTDKNIVTDQNKTNVQQNKQQPLTVNAQVQANARDSFLRYADDLVALTKTTAFGWSKDHPHAPLGWGNGLGAPKSVNLLQAHTLTQDPKYLVAGINSTQFSVGANPENMVFTTGLGDRSPQNPLVIDQRITAQAPPPGITVYGPADFNAYRDYWALRELNQFTFPAPWEWPTVENYFDVYLYPLGAEFTVDYMASSAYTWGYLSARE